MADTINYISSIKLPGSTTEYKIKDNSGLADRISTLEQAGHLSIVISTNAATTPKDVSWKSGSTTITGTLVAADATMAKIYFVPSSTGTKDIYAEYITVHSGSTYAWEKIGNTDIDLSSYATKDTATSQDGNHTHGITGSVAIKTYTKNTTKLTASAEQGAVTLSTTSVVTGVKTTKKALGTNATFQTTVTPNTTKLKVNGTGNFAFSTASKTVVTGVALSGSGVALGTGATFTTTVTPRKMGMSASAKDTAVSGTTSVFISSVSSNRSQLALTTVAPAVSNGTASRITSNAEVKSSSINSWDAGSFTASVSGECLTLDFTAPTLSYSLVTATNTAYSSVTVAKAGTGVTVATGSVDANGKGATISTSINYSTSSALTSVSISKQPTVTLFSTSNSADIQVVELIESATTQIANSDSVDVVTGIAPTTASIVYATGTVSATPSFTLVTTTDSDGVVVATGIQSAATEVSASDAVSVPSEYNTVSAVIDVSVANPVIALTTNAVTGPDVMYSITESSQNANISNLSTTETGAHTHTQK